MPSEPHEGMGPDLEFEFVAGSLPNGACGAAAAAEPLIYP